LSVSGEFQRIVGDAVACLERSPGGSAARLANALEEAARCGRSDLCDGAERVIALLEGPEAAHCRRADLQGEAFGRVTEHLRAICRVILGR
jgi:hypothetical protein